jgi:hypothetical protein
MQAVMLIGLDMLSVLKSCGWICKDEVGIVRSLVIDGIVEISNLGSLYHLH